MIEVKNLSLESNKEILISDLNIDFRPEEFWAILGNNGTGKSTLLETLAGFKSINQGKITINGKALFSFSPLQRAQKISFLTQATEASLNCTVEQNLSYARYPWHQKPIDKQKDRAIIESVMQVMDLQHLRDKNIQQISGGELRKVEIATALVQDSDVLMLDEPLNHLDLAFRIKLMSHLQQLSRKKTIIMVTHDIQYVQKYCSNVIMILNDKKTLVGQVKTLLTAENLTKMLGIPAPNFIKTEQL
jgi:iron complex transport system ATP-binding protein